MLFKSQDFLHCLVVAWIAAQAVAGFSGISQYAATAEVSANLGGIHFLVFVTQRAITNVAPHLAAIEMDALRDFVSTALREFDIIAQRCNA